MLEAKKEYNAPLITILAYPVKREKDVFYIISHAHTVISYILNQLQPWAGLVYYNEHGLLHLVFVL